MAACVKLYISLLAEAREGKPRNRGFGRKALFWLNVGGHDHDATDQAQVPASRYGRGSPAAGAAPGPARWRGPLPLLPCSRSLKRFIYKRTAERYSSVPHCAVSPVAVCLGHSGGVGARGPGAADSRGQSGRDEKTDWAGGNRAGCRCAQHPPKRPPDFKRGVLR